MPSYYIATDRFGNYDLAHHGIIGQKWGVRRYQDKNGSLTEAGKKHYSKMITRKLRKRDAYVVAYRNKHGNKYPKSETASIDDKVRDEYLSSKKFKEYTNDYDKLRTFENEMNNKYSADIKAGYQYFDVYSWDEWQQEQSLHKKLRDSSSELGKEYLRLQQKHKPEFMDAALKDLSIKNADEIKDFIDKDLSSRYGSEWWRMIR